MPLACQRRHVLAAILALSVAVHPVAAVIKATDAAALSALYTATNGAAWLDSTGWLSGTDGCTWFGVTCDTAQEKVVSIALPNNQLYGTLPIELTGCSALACVRV